jgi:hypothetical protein
MTTATASEDVPGALTPAEHRALAEADLRRMRAMTPGLPAYAALAQSGIAHTLAAIACYLDPDEVAEPEVRLPGGQVVRARRSEVGSRLWGYVITGPDGQRPRTSQAYKWGTLETALVAGVAAARAIREAS